jgi:hypothetical protein
MRQIARTVYLRIAGPVERIEQGASQVALGSHRQDPGVHARSRFM